MPPEAAPPEPPAPPPSRGRRVARAAAILALAPAAAWALGAIWFHPWLGPAGPFAAAALVLGTALLAARPGPRRAQALRGAAAALGLVALGWPFARPGPPPAWAPEFARAPRAEIDAEAVRLHDIRDFRWRPDGSAEERWKDEEFPLAGIASVDLLVVPFGPGDHLAHAMLSFGWEDGRRLCVSVEARRAAGIPYHPVAGMYRRYDLHYVIAGEEDSVHLRAAVRGDRVYRFPLRVAPEDRRGALLDILRRANELHRERAYYHSMLASCASTLAAHGHAVAPDRIPRWHWKVFLPAHSGKLVRDAGLLDAPGEWSEVKERFRIDDAYRDRPGSPGGPATPDPAPAPGPR
jgi:hypothetical protein